MPKFHATVRSAEAEDRLLAFIPAVANELRDAVQDVADDAALIFASYAPKGRSGRLGRGIRVVSAQGRLSSGRFATGRQFAIVASAKNKEGFDYVGVSRFGHKQLFIRPSIDRKPASVVSTRKPRRRYGELKKGERPALRIPARNGGPAIYRNVVRGVKRTHDWAETAQDAVNREMDARAEQLATTLARRF